MALLLYVIRFIKLDISPFLLLCNIIYISFLSLFFLIVHIYLLRTQILGVELHLLLLHSDSYSVSVRN